MTIEDMIRAEALRQSVDPDLAAKVGWQESRFRPGAVSPAGARGPMQLMPATARDLGVNVDDPADNIKGGVAYLKQQLDRFHSPRLALAAYNAGPARVARSGGVPNIPETQNYVGKIMGDQGSGADIFGDTGSQPAAQGGSGADIFADAPHPTAAPATAPTAPPVAAQAAVSKPVSQSLGLLEGFMPAIRKLAPYSPANLIPGFKEADAAALGRVQQHIAQREQTQTPGKKGEFAGNVMSTAWIPGGPLLAGAATGALLSKKTDAMGVAGDAAFGAIGGKLGASVIGGLGRAVSGVTDPMVQTLAKKGIPLTVGQMAGGMTKGFEDKATSIPILGDVIRNAQRRSMAGANRAAFNDTLGQVGETLPEHVDIGHDAYSYTRQRLGDLYDEVLAPLAVTKDQPWGQALSAAKAKIGKIGDPAVKADALSILKTSVQSRFDKAGRMVGEDLKDVQSDLGSHINDLTQGNTWQRKAADALRGVKVGMEDLVARTDPAAGEKLAKVNAGWAHLKPLETAAAKSGVKDSGIFNMNQLAQGVTKGKAASTVAAGDAPHQELASAATKVLPSSVPDSGTAGRLMAPAVLGMMFGRSLPAVGPFAIPAAGLIGGTAGLYTRAGQKAATALMTSRTPALRALGKQIRLLSGPAGTGGAVALSGARQ